MQTRALTALEALLYAAAILAAAWLLDGYSIRGAGRQFITS
jgi:hypothetical protein